ncbi:CDP-diglyceride synthetase [Thioflavicoccus mobilis 8321]|uniref:Phosphatidate cytidylyltransferase n=1 Tax=Thioflavicoccus mobilis 8321 TaxID=765912 RepID=L0GS43_9GAMM|nr:phosphatidate cytidylyltransferase [Thioflavicoccus mobilis]AGA89563.1 CDP-diglyceride synthetase [Thioflavicoccus mobilis 8321]
MVGSALRQRAATAALLIPLTVAVVLWLPTPAFALCFAVVVLFGAWEWAALAGLAATRARTAYLIPIAAGMGLLWQTLGAGWSPWVLAGLSLWWWWVALTLPRIRVVEPLRGVTWRLLGSGSLVLLGPWLALVYLHGLGRNGPLLVLFLLVLIWIADSAAYFSGRRWGRVKLAPMLSPGKTWVGAYGALASALIWGLLLVWGLALSWDRALLALAVCVVSVAMSIVGDLYESLLKRRRGLKDSGRLLPGHGGMLDRIDSLTAAAPFFALGLTLLGIGS